MIQTAQVVDQAAFTLAYQVSSAVHAPTCRLKRIGYKTLSAQAWLMVITTGQTIAAQIQFATHPHRQRVHVRVQHVHPTSCNASTNRRIGRVTTVCGLGTPQQRRHHGFCGAVAIDQTLWLKRPLDQLKAGIGHRIATKAVGVDRWRLALGQRHLGQLLQIGRREARHRHVLLMQHLQGVLGRPEVVLANHQTAPRQQHTEPTLLRAVEGKRHKVQFAAVRG